MERNYPFKTLSEKINWIKNNGVEISCLYSFAGNTKVSKMIYESSHKILNKEPRENVIKDLSLAWKQIEKKHPEINEKEVRENIFWYLDAVCLWSRYQEIGMDEIRRK